MVNKYSYSVSWAPEDSVFVARVAEFDSLAAHGSTQEQALSEIKNVVQSVIEDLEANGEPVPQPFCTRQYSGKLNLRMPVSLHQQLAEESVKQGISLNQLINIKLGMSLFQLAQLRVTKP